MGNLRITDLVDPQALEDMKNLNAELIKAKENYADAAKELAKGIKMKVDGIDDLERMQSVLAENAKKADKAAEKLNETMNKQKTIIGQTTNAISRELGEIEKENKAKRESINTDDDALDIAKKVLGSRKDNIQNLIRLQKVLEENKKLQNELTEAEENGIITSEEAINQRIELIDAERKLKEEKKELQKTLALDERMSNAVAGSYNELSQRLEILKRAYKQLTEEEKKQPFGEKLSEEISGLDAELKDLAADMGEFQRNVGNYAIAASDKMSSFLGINEDLGRSLMNLAQNGSAGFASLKTSASAFLKTIMAMLANPAMLALLGIGGAAVAFKWIFDYNKGIAEATKLTHQFTGATGDLLKNQRNEVQALADTYDKDFQEVLISVNAMAQQFGISFEEAFSYVKDGFVSGADVTGEFLDNVKEYPAYFKEAGISASEFIAITTQANKAGIYSDKGIDVIKEGNLRIREMTQATRDALSGIGISATDVMKKLEDGSMTTFDVMKMVSAKLEEYPETSSAVGTAIADIFGGPGEDAGLQYIKTLKDIDTNLDTVKAKAGKLAELEEEQMDAQIEMQNALAAVFDFTGGTFEEVTVKAKTFVKKGITSIIVGFIKLYNYVADLYNSSEGFRILWETISFSFKTNMTMIISLFKGFQSQVYAVGNILKGAFTLDWDLMKQGMKDYAKSYKEFAVNIAKGVKTDFNIAKNNVKNNRMELKTVPGTDVEDEPDENDVPSPKKGRKKAKGLTPQELAKQADERKKIIASLRQSEIDMMDDGFKKEQERIKENHRKRLEEITGNSEEEKKLKRNLTAVYMKEMADYKRAYEEERAKLDIEYQLEYVEEGSEEKLELLKSKLDLEREAELEAAEKTGADKSLIEEMYKAKEIELEETFAEERAEKIQEQYANESVLDEIRLSEKLSNLKNAYAEGKITIEEYEEQKAAIEDQYAVMSAEKAKSLFGQILNIEGLSADKRAEIMAKLAKAGIDLENAKADATVNAKEREKKADDDATQKRMENLNKISEVMNMANQAGNQIFEAKLSRLDEESERNQADYEEEIERIEQLEETGAITKEEAEARKQAAESKTKDKEKEIEKERQKIQQKQAIWNKANQLAQTGIATARGIMEAIAELGPIAGPIMAATVAAMGAVQAATIIATPIPKYAKGTDSHPGGLAMVGDGGKREVVLTPEGFWLTPNTPTLVNLPKGAEVFPDMNVFNAYNVLSAVHLDNAPSNQSPSSVVVNNDYRRLERGQESLINAVKMNTKEQRRIARRIEFETYKSENL